MPKSKQRNNHKQKVKTSKEAALHTFKTKIKKMSENQQAQQAQQMPPVRTVPTWGPESEILVKGFEWEAIQNGLANLQLALQAGQSIMSRNIVSGVISMDFEKLNPQTLQYEAMPEEEKTEHRAAFAQQVEAFKTAQAQAAQAQTQSATTATVQPDNAPTAAQPATETAPKKAKKSGKVVNLEGSK